MMTLHGTVLNVIKREPRPGAERTFEPYGQVQLQTVERLDDGQDKIGLHTLSFDVDQLASYEAFKGKTVSLPVRCYVRNGGVQMALQRDATPIRDTSATAAE